MWTRLEQRELNRLARRITGGPGELPAPDRPAGTDLLPQLKHIVVLMMENHSYDNYLGMLAGRGDGFPLGPDGEPEVSNTGLEGESVPAHHLASTVQVTESPTQSWHASHLQWDDGKLDGFVTATQQLTPGQDATPAMGYWTERDLPFYYGLARTFPLADRWYSSCLGPTFPNRRFLISGTANGLIDDLPVDLADYPANGTIFDVLSRHNVSWVNYHPVAGSQTRYGRALRHRTKVLRRRLRTLRRVAPGSLTGLQKDIQFTGDIYPLGIARYMLHVRSTDEFFSDAAAGTLPAFSIVDPDFSAYSEENPQDIQKGESFAAAVIDAVLHGQGWPNTLLIWLYDEGGGYYDHVPPPPALAPDNIPPAVPAGESTYDGFHRYGFRVPCAVVSPWARRDYISHQVKDHTSICALIEAKWNLPAMTYRDANANPMLDMIDLRYPAFRTPPPLAQPLLATDPGAMACSVSGPGTIPPPGSVSPAP